MCTTDLTKSTHCIFALKLVTSLFAIDGQHWWLAVVDHSVVYLLLNVVVVCVVFLTICKVEGEKLNKRFTFIALCSNDVFLKTTRLLWITWKGVCISISHLMPLFS